MGSTAIRLRADDPAPPSIGVRGWAIAAVLLALIAGILLAMGRPAICECGVVSFWHGKVHSPQNSQQIADWYTFSHVIHGFIFYALFGWGARRLWPALPMAAALALSILVEGAWEIAENSPVIIDRYREATMAYGYAGDSVLNSVADTAWMVVGFAVARIIPVWSTVALAIAFELMTLALIRDNLVLNVVMLVSPVDAIREWQAAAGDI